MSKSTTHKFFKDLLNAWNKNWVFISSVIVRDGKIDLDDGYYWKDESKYSSMKDELDKVVNNIKENKKLENSEPFSITKFLTKNIGRNSFLLHCENNKITVSDLQTNANSDSKKEIEAKLNQNGNYTLNFYKNQLQSNKNLKFYFIKSQKDKSLKGIITFCYEGEKLEKYEEIIFQSICEEVIIEQLLVILEKEKTTTAINQILLDSYAHNISAHSLNFLQQLFNRRNDELLKKHYPLVSFGKLNGLPLNKVTYADFFDANKVNRDSDNSEDIIYYKAIGESDSTNTIFDATLLDYILYGKEKNATDLLKYDSENEAGKLPMPLDYAIAPLLTYLRDKGAFWSGIIRDNKATPSQIVSFYDVLMEMCNNPLFIGSIMAAEEIFIIHIFINTECEENDRYKNVNKKPSHFLTINIKEFVEAELGIKIDKEKEECNNNQKYKYLNDTHSNMSFVRLSKNHALLREILQKQSILLPGGIVGKHAFFTIIENTLRNAKHLKKEHRDDIKKNGLELHFYIREEKFAIEKTVEEFYIEYYRKINAKNTNSDAQSKLDKATKTVMDNLNGKGLRNDINSGNDGTVKNKIKECFVGEANDEDNFITPLAKKLLDKELYRVGIHLGFETSDDDNNTQKKEDKQKSLIQSVIKNSYQPILSEDGKPNMGGSSQDKICAAALFNCTFSSVEYPHTDVQFNYPWISYNLCPDAVPNGIEKHAVYGDFVLFPKIIQFESLIFFINFKSIIQGYEKFKIHREPNSGYYQ